MIKKKNNYKKFDNIRPKKKDYPKTAYLAYVVCGPEKGHCGWIGWIIESVYSKDIADIIKNRDPNVLPAASNQKCPQCGKIVYRVGVRAECSKIKIIMD
jgi:hypothetical protein